MSVVFNAADTRLGCCVAPKFLPASSRASRWSASVFDAMHAPLLPESAQYQKSAARPLETDAC